MRQPFGRRFLLCFCFFYCLELSFTRCIGLFYGALGMDTPGGVRALSTNRTDLPVFIIKGWSGLFVSHAALITVACRFTSNLYFAIL